MNTKTFKIQICFVSVCIFVLITNVSWGFETAQGRYLSRQDLLITLSDIFKIDINQLQINVNAANNFEKYEVNYEVLNSCLKVPSNSYDYKKIPLELGFQNLISGQKSFNEPNENYILFIRVCISKLVNYQSNKIKLFESILGSVWSNKIFTISKFLNVEPYQVKWNNLSSNEKFDFVNTVFLSVLGSDQFMTKNLLNNINNLILTLDASLSITLTEVLRELLNTIIISEEFLKYEDFNLETQ